MKGRGVIIDGNCNENDNHCNKDTESVNSLNMEAVEWEQFVGKFLYPEMEVLRISKSQYKSEPSVIGQSIRASNYKAFHCSIRACFMSYMVIQNK